MMTSTDEKFNQYENVRFKGDLVPEKPFFSAGLEQDVKAIIQECQFLKPSGRSNNRNKKRMNYDYRNNVNKKKSKRRSPQTKTDTSTKRVRNFTVKREKLLKNSSGSPNCLARRNWQKLSIHPFINFMRVFRKKAPGDCPLHVMRMKAREIWRKMNKVRKYPYLEQALKAKQKGYVT